MRQPTPAQLALLVIVSLIVWKSLQTDGNNGRIRRDIVRVTVDRVLDGDTFDTVDGVRVRLLGIDAPEVAHHDEPGQQHGTESGTWLAELLKGKTVALHLESERHDRYGRTLAWVYVDDGRLVNLLALETGNARLLSRFGLPQDLETELRRAEAVARAKELGLWRR